MYYPTCSNGPNHTPGEPCIPFPPPPKPCNASMTQTLANLGLNIKMKPCLNISPDGICVDGLKPETTRSIMKKSIFSFNKNKKNFVNLKRIEEISKNKDIIILYNKWLLFNSKCQGNNI
jgi:hypothetical protein